MSGQGWLFVQFVRQLLASLPGVTDLEVQRDLSTVDVPADLVARFEGRPLLVEVKLQTPQTRRRLQAMIEQLGHAWAAYQQRYGLHPQPRLVVAFPGVLSEQRQMSIQATGVEIWDGVTMRRLAGSLGVYPPEFLAVPEEDELPARREPADELLRRLETIPLGKDGWPSFEQFVEDLLNLLFVPPLNTVIAQSSNDNGVNRRDFVLPNYAPADTFWGFLRTHHRGDFIVADAKNYTKPVAKQEVLQLANYLSHHGTGLVGMLLTRKGLAPDGRWTSREQGLLYNKLIVGLSEGDYRQMLRTQRSGGDPAELVRQRIEDFRLRI